MTKHHPHSVTKAMGNQHDYLPAAGRDGLLPIYDLLSRLYGGPKIHATLLTQAGIADDHRVLEIGCGTGSLTVRAKRSHPGVDIVGSDPDPRALARAERKVRGLSGIRFEQGYAQRLPYADGEFDRVLSAFMLHHLDTDVKAAAAAEALRVLRPGGRLHLVDVGGTITPDDGFLVRRMRHNPHVRDNLDDNIPRLLRTAGFDCREVATQRNRRIGLVTYYSATRPK